MITVKTPPDKATNESENLLDYLGGWWQYSETLCSAFGGDYSLWLTYLINHRKMLITTGKIKKGDLFFCDQSLIEIKTHIGPIVQTTIIKKLQDLEILQVSRRGTPPRNYYRINVKNMVNYSSILTRINDYIREQTGKPCHIFKSTDSKKLNQIFKSIESMDLNLTAKSIDSMDLYNKTLGLSKERPDIHSVNVTTLDESSNNDTSTQSQPTVTLKRRKRTTLLVNSTPIVDSLSTDNSLSSKQKEIIRFWNIQPNTKHMRLPNGNKPTKTYNRVTRKILPQIIDDYPLSEIKQSIKTYSDILGDQRNFGLREEVIGHKVGPDEFFKGFSNDTKSRMFDTNIVKKSTVWFQECMKSRSYLEETYGHWIEDPNPKVTQEFKEMFLNPLTPTTHGNRVYPHPPEWYEVEFKESQAAELNGVSIVEENLFRLATKRLLQFMKTYEIGSTNSPIQSLTSNPVHFVVAVYRAIAEEVNGGTFKPNIGWVAATKTYEERLPNIFKSAGEMKENIVPLQMPWKDYTEKRV